MHQLLWPPTAVSSLLTRFTKALEDRPAKQQGANPPATIFNIGVEFWLNSASSDELSACKAKITCTQIYSDEYEAGQQEVWTTSEEVNAPLRQLGLSASFSRLFSCPSSTPASSRRAELEAHEVGNLPCPRNAPPMGRSPCFVPRLLDSKTGSRCSTVKVTKP